MVSNDIGSVAWTDDQMRESYQEFKKVYERAPVKDNEGGMKAPHAFLTWFILSKLQPSLIIESGIWKGQGTWLIEQACPNANLVCIDIDLSRLEYKSKKATYYDKDFGIIDFNGRDLSTSLCFFDDHQNALMRLQQMLWKGFKKAIFEDNYPNLRGDCYSIKKMLGNHGFLPEVRKPKTVKGIVKNYARQMLKVDKSQFINPNEAHGKEFRNQVQTYYEGPPLFRLDETRWGDKWDDVSLATKAALFPDGEKDDLFDEAKAYNWLCYVELK